MAVCPHCGKQIQLTKPGNRRRFSPQWSQAQQFQSVQPSIRPNAMQDVAEYHRETPARPPNVESDVAVPALQSVGWGIAAAVASVSLPLFYGWPWYTPLITGTVATPLAWTLTTAGLRRGLWVVESVTNRDINQDGAVGKPETAEVLLTVTEQGATGNTTRAKRQRIAVAPGLFQSWAMQVATGAKSISEAQWVGAGKPFSKTQYRGMLAGLAETGIIAKSGNASNSKWTITHGGRSALLYWARVTDENQLPVQTGRQTDIG
jgi:hypothetical protein